MSGFESDEGDEEEVTFVPISLGTAEASMPDYLKVRLHCSCTVGGVTFASWIAFRSRVSCTSERLPCIQFVGRVYGGVSPSMSGLDSSDEGDEQEVTFVPISLGTAEASMPDYLKV
jgi:hypothetical protein